MNESPPPRRKRGVLYRLDMNEVELADAVAPADGDYKMPFDEGLRAVIPEFIFLAAQCDAMMTAGTAREPLTPEDLDAFRTLLRAEDDLERYMRRKSRRRATLVSVALLAGLTEIYKERGHSADSLQKRLRDLWSRYGVALFPEDLDSLVLMEDEIREHNGPAEAAKNALSEVLGLTPRQMANRKKDARPETGLWGHEPRSPQEVLRYLFREVYEWPRKETEAVIALLPTVRRSYRRTYRNMRRRLVALNEYVIDPAAATAEKVETSGRATRPRRRRGSESPPDPVPKRSKSRI